MTPLPATCGLCRENRRQRRHQLNFPNASNVEKLRCLCQRPQPIRTGLQRGFMSKLCEHRDAENSVRRGVARVVNSHNRPCKPRDAENSVRHGVVSVVELVLGRAKQKLWRSRVQATEAENSTSSSLLGCRVCTRAPSVDTRKRPPR